MLLVSGLAACVSPEAPSGASSDASVPAPETTAPVAPPGVDPVGGSGTGAVGTTGPGPAPDPLPMSGFSFVDETVAGMPRPEWEDLAFLQDQDLSLVITLTEDPLDPAIVEELGTDWLHLPVEDFAAPTLEQQDALVAAVEERRDAGEHVAVHCLVGMGRTGTMLATWLVAEGYEPQAAIDEIRRLRPGSIESVAQEEAVFAWAATRSAP